MKAWLKSTIKPGLFSDERIAWVRLRDGSSTAYFVDERETREGGMRVRVVVRNGVKWATLPTDHPYHPIPVPDEDVEPIEEGVVSA